MEIIETRKVRNTTLAIYSIDGRRGASFIPSGVDAAAWLSESLGLAPVEQSIEERLLAVGGSRWTKHDKDRIYFNDLPAWYGLELSRYKTGNISSATLDGEPISNSAARKAVMALDGKIFWDVPTQTWVMSYVAESYGSVVIEAIEERAGLTAESAAA